MAVYGRSREKWDPTKIKSKVSKNKTYELSTASTYATALANGKMLFYLDADTITTDTSDPPVQLQVLGTTDVSGEEVLDIRATGGLTVGINRVRNSHFLPSAINFPKSGTNRVFVQSDGISTHGFSLRDLAGSTASSHRASDTYISFWVNISQTNFLSDNGHCIGGFYRGIPNVLSQTAESTNIATINPAILFGITSSGAPEVRFHRDGDPTKCTRFEGPAGSEDLRILSLIHI